MPIVPFALYDAFTDVSFGGSQAGVVSNAASIEPELRSRIAKELGMPATCFVDRCSEDAVEAQFYSTVMELPMCGHGTMCLMSRMVELGVFKLGPTATKAITLKLPSGNASVELTRRSDGRTVTMLDVMTPSFSSVNLDTSRLAELLGADRSIYSNTTPIEIASGDFVHLVVPIVDLKNMRRIAPDFPGVTRFCNDHGIETVVVFSTEVEHSESTIHVRDFCPAVGVAESASAGTTNAALTSYLIRHGVVQANAEGTVIVQAEQGMEIGRASIIHSTARLQDSTIGRLQVGGVATKIMDGHLHLPD